jgi:hypothetical protein
MKYQARDRVDNAEHTPELQWLEDGVNILASTAANCTRTILLGVLELLSGKTR